MQVLSYDVGAHPGLDSTFIILDFKEPALSSAVYVEGLVGQLYLERETDIDRYSHAFDQLRAMALSPAASIDLVAKISRDLDVYH